MNTISKWLTVLALLSGPPWAHATVFQGQDANGAFDNSCMVSGVSACVMYYDSNLNIEILNNWNIGAGTWSGVQTLAEAAGFTATGLTGWVLPTESGNVSAGASNQYLSIWQDVGSSLSGLQAQFAGVQNFYYWSGTEFSPALGAWYFGTGDGFQNVGGEFNDYYAVAVRPGEVSDVPLPAAVWLLLSGLGSLGAMVRKRKSN